MSAWSKEVLGWANVQLLDPGTDLGTLSLPPVETSGDIYRIGSGDGSSDYLLLENRQRMGFDQHLYEPGLLIWHIDPVTIENHPHGINNDPDRMGVWLRQADGLNDLGQQGGGRGDGGDPFPGSSGNTLFHAGSDPSSWTHDGNSMGVTILNIEQVGENMDFRALTRYQALTLRTLGSPSGGGLVSVDGIPPESSEWVLNSAPFQQHTIEAASGEEVEEGIRVAFQGWTDGAPRIGNGMGWVPEGESVTVTASPRTGFEFLEWSGAFHGLPNPAPFTPTGPIQSEAVFGVTFTAESNPSTVELAGGIQHSLTLSVENANLPVNWSVVSGTFPPSMNLNPTGSIQGTPLVRGDFPMTLRAVDAIGLQALLPLNLVVDDPEIPVDALASAFLLTGPFLSANTRIYLDNEGNNNNAYDLGDFRAYVLRNPGLPSFGQLESLVEILVPMGDMKSPPSGGGLKREERP